MRATRSLPALAVLWSGLVLHPAQGSRVTDEGSFTVAISGRTAGRENFRITAVTGATGPEFLARADAAFGDRKVSPELRTDDSGGALTYNAIRTGEGAGTWRGVITRGRLSATITTARGPSARELIVPPGSAILDDDVMHQHHFIARRTHNGRVPVIIPHRNEQTLVTVSTVGTEPLMVGTREMSAIHLRLETAGGERRDVWVDGENRVLKVEIPSRRLMAVRDDPPR